MHLLIDNEAVREALKEEAKNRRLLIGSYFAGVGRCSLFGTQLFVGFKDHKPHARLLVNPNRIDQMQEHARRR
jgi:hypothetical protein